MKKIKLTKEEQEQMSYADVAYLVLKEKGNKMTIQDIFKEVISIMSLPESDFENKIGDFFGLLSTDKRFIMLEKGFWDLKDNHSTKVVIEEDDEEDLTEEYNEVEETETEEETDNEEINYDDDSVDDDDEEDDLKDLVIMDENDDDQDMM